VIAKAVEHQGDQVSRGATRPMLRPRRCATRSRRCPTRVWAGTRCTASTAAQRTNLLPCLMIRPRCTVVSGRRVQGARASAGFRQGPRRSRTPLSGIPPTNGARHAQDPTTDSRGRVPRARLVGWPSAPGGRARAGRDRVGRHLRRGRRRGHGAARGRAGDVAVRTRHRSPVAGQPLSDTAAFRAAEPGDRPRRAAGSGLPPARLGARLHRRPDVRLSDQPARGDRPPGRLVGLPGAAHEGHLGWGGARHGRDRGAEPAGERVRTG
jgi:hypothetical protein